MALRTQTATLPFRDSGGNPTDASFVIRERLSHDAKATYLMALQRALAGATPDAEGNIPEFELDHEALQESRHLLVAGGLLEIRGVEDENGQPYTPQRAFEMDVELTRQVVDALFERNKAKPDPNSDAPSGA